MFCCQGALDQNISAEEWRQEGPHYPACFSSSISAALINIERLLREREMKREQGVDMMCSNDSVPLWVSGRHLWTFGKRSLVVKVCRHRVLTAYKYFRHCFSWRVTQRLIVQTEENWFLFLKRGASVEKSTLLSHNVWTEHQLIHVSHLTLAPEQTC